jgi:hypothetical protein
MGHMLIELPRIGSAAARAPLAELCVSSSAATEGLPCRADDELSIITASRYSRPGWLWLGYMAFGVAFWAGLGFAIRALIVAI